MYYMTYFVPKMHFAVLMSNLRDRQTKDEYGIGVRTTDYYALDCERIRKVVPGSRLWTGGSRCVNTWEGKSPNASIRMEMTAGRRIR